VALTETTVNGVPLGIWVPGTRTVVLPGVQFSEAHAARVFVLAGDKQVRGEVEKASNP